MITSSDSEKLPVETKADGKTPYKFKVQLHHHICIGLHTNKKIKNKNNKKVYIGCNILNDIDSYIKARCKLILGSFWNFSFEIPMHF